MLFGEEKEKIRITFLKNKKLYTTRATTVIHGEAAAGGGMGLTV
jgi:5-methylthioribose kinase